LACIHFTALIKEPGRDNRTVRIDRFPKVPVKGTHVLYFLQIVTNVVVQLIVLLYLIDNNENTSWMILAGSGMGVVIEAWKVITLICIFP
jgi:hypothetical protein